MNSIISFLLLIFTACVSLISSAYPQQFDQSYLKWKAEQEAHDQRLNRQSANHYLSRPAVNTSSKQSAGGVGQSTKVRLNTASMVELQMIKGVGEKKAAAIIEYRQKHGSFKSVDELQNVKGIGPKFIEKNRNQLAL
ncbi:MULTISPECIES: ComEA family DNA-binding protein [unclassified Acinetobacter]|uniref:ComEA family DNA-binding protein n=1 Tax=unclassified Acinetobacter TaxID=196816 RepID=UPI00044A2DFD|nr:MULTISPECIES: ComEA family DNA-binding protein [unclassified Acinetobacter]EZQ11788.1 transporter [Acinetobacter sp. Ver3]